MPRNQSKVISHIFIEHLQKHYHHDEDHPRPCPALLPHPLLPGQPQDPEAAVPQHLREHKDHEDHGGYEAEEKCEEGRLGAVDLLQLPGHRLLFWGDHAGNNNQIKHIKC